MVKLVRGKSALNAKPVPDMAAAPYTKPQMTM